MASAPNGLDEEVLLESSQPRQQAPKWRRLGLGVALVGTIGAMVGAAWPRQRLTTLQRMKHMTQAFMRGFDARQLTPAEELFAMDMKFVWAEEGEKEPAAMTIDAALKQSDGKAADPIIKFVFVANENEGEALKDKINDFKHAVRTDVLKMEGERAGKMFDRVIHVAEDGDEVSIQINLPPGTFDKDKVKESFHEDTPSFEAHLGFGRTLPEIFENQKEHPAVLTSGIKATMHTLLAKKLISGMEEVSKENVDGMDDVSKETWDVLESMTGIGAETTIRYRKAELLESLGELPILHRMLRKVQSQIGQLCLPPTVTTPLKALKDNSAGLKSIEVQGLPENWEVSFTFKDFRVTPVISAVVEGADESACKEAFGMFT